MTGSVSRDNACLNGTDSLITDALLHDPEYKTRTRSTRFCPWRTLGFS
jgi:hypothetical protein